MDLAARGAAAISSGDYAEAIKHYTAALQTNPTAVDYYIKRSTAYQRSSPADCGAALLDAERAVVLAHKRGKRELIAQAQLRRGIALFGLERYGDAGFCFSIVRKLNKDEKSLTIWDSKVKTKQAGLAEDDEKRKATILEMPDINVDAIHSEKIAEGQKDILAAQSSDNKAKSGTSSTTTQEQPENKPAVGVTTPASKIRHDWYQTNENVTVTLLAKGVPKDKATVDIQERFLAISFPLPSSSTFDFSLDPLFASIDPAKSSFKIMSTKIEIVLKKTNPGFKWHSLEASPLEDSSNTTSTAASAVAEKPTPTVSIPSRPAPVSATAATAPSYPTSSKSGPKDWDKVAADLSKQPKKPEGSAKEGNDEAGEEDDDDGGDPVNAFFKKLYASADPDTRRAMMKSYQESNGTALSTNWTEVGKKKVETTPPDGMVAKKWGE